LTVPSHQLAFTLTAWLSTQLLEVCPYVRKVTGLRIDGLSWLATVHPKSEFSTASFPCRGCFPLFLDPRNTIENHHYLPHTPRQRLTPNGSIESAPDSIFRLIQLHLPDHFR
jgi:hypothetical protein